MPQNIDMVCSDNHFIVFSFQDILLKPVGRIFQGIVVVIRFIISIGMFQSPHRFIKINIVVRMIFHHVDHGQA